MKPILECLGKLIFPPRCASCRRFLDVDFLDDPAEPEVLCGRCRERWELSKMEICEGCGAEFGACRCIPKSLRGVDRVLSLVSYEKSRSTVGKRCILYLKRNNEKAAFRFFASELAGILLPCFEEYGISPSHTLVTFVPRGLKNKNEYGFDQSEQLAVCVAEQVGAHFGKVFSRRLFRSREQKKLSREKRFESAAGAFGLCREIGDEQCLVIVDDVITTGASFVGCVSLLKKRFGGRVICLTLGRTKNRD